MAERQQQLKADDGAMLRVTSVGSGPGVVVVHGGGVTASMYRRLAERLSSRLTVHLYNRRGRADAPPRREPYEIAHDVADLAVILRGTERRVGDRSQLRRLHRSRCRAAAGDRQARALRRRRQHRWWLPRRLAPRGPRRS